MCCTTSSCFDSSHDTMDFQFIIVIVGSLFRNKNLRLIDFHPSKGRFIFLACLGLTVLPVNIVVGSYISNIFEERWSSKNYEGFCSVTIDMRSLLSQSDESLIYPFLVCFHLQTSTINIRNHCLHWTDSKLPCFHPLLSDAVCWLGPYHVCICWSPRR